MKLILLKDAGSFLVWFKNNIIPEYALYKEVDAEVLLAAIEVVPSALKLFFK